MNNRILDKTILSPLMYFGNRYPSLNDYFDLINKGKKSLRYECFYDLFSGCGSIGLEAINQRTAKQIVINDAYPEFMYFWNTIRDHHQDLIHTHQNLVDDFAKINYLEKIHFYNSLQNEFNSNSESSIKKSAQFAFLINHSENNELKIKDHSLICSLEIESKLKNATTHDNYFPEYVKDVFVLFNSDDIQIQFDAVSFKEYVSKIQQNDFVFLDPPYPCTASPIYFRTNEQIELKKEIDDAVSQWEKKHTDYMINYELVGKEFDQDLIKGARHWMHLSLTPNTAYPEYVENVFISNSLSNRLIEKKFSPPQFLIVNDVTQKNWLACDYASIPKLFKDRIKSINILLQNNDLFNLKNNQKNLFFSECDKKPAPFNFQSKEIDTIPTRSIYTQ